MHTCHSPYMSFNLLALQDGSSATVLSHQTLGSIYADNRIELLESLVGVHYILKIVCRKQKSAFGTTVERTTTMNSVKHFRRSWSGSDRNKRPGMRERHSLKYRKAVKLEDVTLWWSFSPLWP